MRARIITELVALFVCCSAIAAEKHVVTVDDLFTLANVTETEISFTGDRVAYLDGRWQAAANGRKSDVWIAYADGRPATRLTYDGAGYASLKWSPDGRFLYFKGSRTRAESKLPPFNGVSQVWRMNVDGGDIVPVTREAIDISAFELTFDGSALYFMTTSSEYGDDWSKLRTDFTDLQYGESKTYSTNLSKLDLTNWRVQKIVDFKGYVDAFTVTADQSRLALVTAGNNEVATLEGKSRLTIVDVKAGTTSDLADNVWREAAPSPFGQLSSPSWSKDGQVLAFVISFDGYPNELIVADWTGQGAPKIKKLPRPSGVSLLGGVGSSPKLSWRGASRDLCFLGEQHARVRAYVIPNVLGAADKSEVLTPGDVVVDAFSLNGAGDQLAALASGPTFMPDVYWYQGEKGKAISQVNSHTQDWKLPRLEIVTWKGAGEATVEGVLELPSDYHPGMDPLPLIVNLHGGPTYAWPFRQQYGYQGGILQASQGYALFSPNYRGSTGYGDAFLTDLIGRENDIEVEDILKGIDHLIAQKTVHPDQICISGWSNGGYLTNCLIARRKFAAASSGAGIVDAVQHWGTTDEPAFMRVFAKGTLWQQPDAYRQFSPIWQMEKVQTPTLIHVCSGDARCPPGNSRMLYRALQTAGTRAELVVYPDGAHGISLYQSRKAKLTWDMAWFDHFARGRPLPGKENTDGAAKPK